MDEADFALPRIKVIPPVFDAPIAFDADGNPVEQENLAADAAQGINMGLETGSMDTAAMSQLSKEFGGGHSVASGAS